MGAMFFVLSKSPKGNEYILGKRRGIKKTYFVIACVVLAFLIFMLIAASQGELITDTEARSSITANTSSPTKFESPGEEIALTHEEERFVQAFGCTATQAIQLYEVFDEVGLTLSGADKVTRREDLDNWDGDGSIAYEVADVVRVDGEQQRAFLYVTNDFQVLDIRFLSCYLYEDGAFVQTAEQAVNVGWSASLFEEDCPISVSASMSADLIGTPVVEATITNLSNQPVAAVRILAHPLDVYGDAIQSYGFGEEYINLTSDETLDAGESKTVTWTLYGYDTAKTAELWIYSVYFENGAQWGSYDSLSVEIMQAYGVALTAN